MESLGNGGKRELCLLLLADCCLLLYSFFIY